MAAQRLLLLAAVGLVGLELAACGGQPAPQQPEKPRLAVGLLTSAAASPRWERQANLGLERIAAELGADIRRSSLTEAVVTRDLLVQDGGRPVDLVFCVGSDFANPVFTEAPSHPSTRFVLVGGRGHGANVAGIELLPAGAGYVAGVVAATLRPASAVGILHGAGGAWLEELERGFLTGFRSVRRGAKVVEAGSAEGPWDLAADGVEIALYSTDQPEDEALAAAHDAGVLLVAADSTLLARDPDVVAAAVQADLAEAMVRLAREVEAGTFVAGQYAFDLGSGVLDVRLNPTLPDSHVPALRDALEVARSEATAGIVELEGLGM
jgi:basic membrane lipoprotein Med (substrate-binding protein (PBP1-ABC) superfamily)